MNWPAFVHMDTKYDLSHLDGFSYDLIVPEKDGKAEQRYRLNVIFSIHCFSRGAKRDEVIPRELAYSDARETRIFDFDRYQQSKMLRGIVETLDARKCYHDRHGQFYVFETTDSAGKPAYYSVFFSVSKAGKKAGLNLYISTAHMRPEPPLVKNVKPVRFRVIVHNIWTAKGIKPAP